MSFRSEWFVHPRFQEVASGCGLVKQGHRGSPVKTLQLAMIALGQQLPISTARLGVPDGIFGSETHHAVRALQKQSGKSVDGKVGPNTLNALDRQLTRVTPPISSKVIWGEAPPPVPGQPEEIDLGPSIVNVSPWAPNAVKQIHSMACWAACLIYWARHCGGGRPMKLKQIDLNAMYSELTDDSPGSMGGMSLKGIRSIMNDHATPIEPGESSVSSLYMALRSICLSFIGRPPPQWRAQ
ncbi:MAG: peptidoglycan-binding protein [Planctomycetota bacterium]